VGLGEEQCRKFRFNSAARSRPYSYSGTIMFHTILAKNGAPNSSVAWHHCIHDSFAAQFFILEVTAHKNIWIITKSYKQPNHTFTPTKTYTLNELAFPQNTRKNTDVFGVWGGGVTSLGKAAQTFGKKKKNSLALVLLWLRNFGTVEHFKFWGSNQVLEFKEMKESLFLSEEIRIIQRISERHQTYAISLWIRSQMTDKHNKQ
jgi:hypothetical protein